MYHKIFYCHIFLLLWDGEFLAGLLQTPSNQYQHMLIPVTHIHIILFYTFNVSNLCILYPWWWSHIWPKDVGVHCMYKWISVYMGAIFVYIFNKCMDHVHMGFRHLACDRTGSG